VSELQADRPPPLGGGAAPPVTYPPPRPGGAGAAWLRGRVREPYIQLLAAQLLVGGVAAIANVLMARALIPSGRGEVALMLQVAYLCSQGLLLGTERSFVAGYHGAPPAVAVRAYGRLVVVPCGIGLVAALVFAVAAPPAVSPGPLIIGLVAGYAIVQVLILAMRSIAVATGRVADFVRCTVIDSVILLTTMIALYAAGVAHPAVWLLAYVLAGSLPTVAYWIFWWRTSVPTTATGTVGHRVVRREGLVLFPAAIANMGMLRVDRLALPALASTTALGLYATVAALTELLAWPLRAYADSRLGRWRAAHRSGTLRIRPLVLRATGYAVLVAPVLAGGLYLLVVPVFGEQYAPARVLVLPLVAAAGLYAVSRVSLGLLIAKGRNLLVSAAEICGFAVSLTAYLMLIPRYGILGAAYGSLLGYGACLLFAVAAIRLAADSRTGRSAVPASAPQPATSEAP
jgi:O-antigen/teichoic acid export membrane protein